jgi:hypothetical protein
MELDERTLSLQFLLFFSGTKTERSNITVAPKEQRQLGTWAG